jgi:hypothetical protein
MSRELAPDLDGRRFAAVADDDRVTRTVAALEDARAQAFVLVDEALGF